MMRSPWFGPRRYGFGVTPVSWKGWAVTVGFLAAVLVWSAWAPRHGLLLFGAGEIALVAAMFWITQATDDGRPWRWRWGDDERRP